MAIQEVVDPRTKKKITLVEGKITGLFFNEIPEDKRVSYGKGWTPTHRVNLLVDGTKIGLGMTDKDRVGVKDSEDNWHDLAKGLEVSVEVTKKGEYFNATPADVIVTDASGKEAPAPQQTAGGTQKQSGGGDKTGVSVGHAINGAMLLLDNAPETFANLVEVAKGVHDVTMSVKADYAKKNPDMWVGDVGAASGHAILNACKMVSSVEEVEAVALDILKEVVPEVMEYVKASTKKDEPKTQAKKTAPKKTAPKKEAAKPVESENPAPQGGVADMDDDIPF